GIYLGSDNYSIQAHFGAWHTALTYTNLAGTATDFSTSTSNLTLNSNKFVFLEPTSGTAATAKYYFITSGDITLQSVGTTFTS
ncbi:hypothetical protein OSL14_24700, partial [Escherichia coli]|nr:hypothetical protein [Escherichia coli]